MRVVRRLPVRPGRLRSPLTARSLSAGCTFVPQARASIPAGAGPIAVRRAMPVHAGGDGRPPRFLGNPCGSVPRARDSGGSQRPRLHGRPDAAFRLPNGVGIRHGERFRSCTLAARFLAAYASPRQSPGEKQGSRPACPLRRWPGWTFTSWIPSRGFGQPMYDVPLSQACPGAIATFLAKPRP
jgi:hypothetical protein